MKHFVSSVTDWLLLLSLRVCFLLLFFFFFWCLLIQNQQIETFARWLSQGVPFLGHLHAKQLHLDLRQLLQHRCTECGNCAHCQEEEFQCTESPTGTIVPPEGAVFHPMIWCIGAGYTDYLHLSSNAYVNIFDFQNCGKGDSCIFITPAVWGQTLFKY